MRRWQRVILVAGISALAVPNLHAQKLTEKQALFRMREEHPKAHVLDLEVHEFEANIRERSLLTNPTFNYSRENTALGVDNFFTVTQELPIRGHLGLLGKAAGQATTAARARTVADMLAFETSLRLAFADLQLAQENFNLLKSRLAELSRLVDVLRTREKEGESSRFDLLRAEREVANIRADMETSKINRLRAQIYLASYFAPGSDPTGLEAADWLIDNSAIPNLDVLLDNALINRPDYRALTLGHARWETERRAAKRLRLPGASLSAGLKRTRSSAVNDSGYALTASVTIPLFNRGQAQVARAEAARTRVSTEQLLLRTRIESEVREAHAVASRYTALALRYRTESVELANELVSIATTAYEEGEYGILELLDAHSVKLETEQRLQELSAAACRALIHLDQAIGRRRMP